MIIKRLILKNWGPHKDLDWDMDCPVFGLIGPNGSGKTNVLDAIGLIFTGKLSKKDNGKARTQETFIYMEKGERADNASVELHFSKGGLLAKAFRQIGKTPKRWLEWEGSENGKRITKSKDIDELMEEILDCDKEAMDLAVFLTQGGIGKFLFMTEAKRESEFAGMTLIDHLDTVADIAGQEATRVRGMITDLGPQKDEATRNRQEQQDALEVAEAALKAHKDPTAEIARKTTRLRHLERVKECKLEFDVADLAIRDKATIEEPLTLDELQKQGEDKAAALRDAASKKESATRARAVLESKGKKRARVTVLDEEIAKNPELAKAKELSEVDVSTGTRKLADLMTQQETLREKLAASQRDKDLAAGVKRALDALGEAKSTRQTRQEKFDEHARTPVIPKEEDAEIREKIRLLDESVRLTPFVIQMAELGDCNDKACALCGSTDWKGLPGPDEILKLKAQLKDARDKISIYSEELNQREELRSKHERTKGILAAELKASEEYLARAQKEVEGLEYPKGGYESVEVLSDQLRQMSEPIQKAKTDLDTARQQLQDLTNRLSVAKLREEERDGLRAEIAELPADEVLEKEAAASQPTEELETELAAIRARWQRAKAYHDEVAALQRALKDAQERLTAAGRVVEEDIRATGDISEDPAADLEALQQKQREYQQCQGAVENATASFRRAEKRLLEVEERITGQLHIQDVIGQLDTLKSHFSRTGIPRHYLSRVFDNLVALTQDNLAEWEEDFQVIKDPEMLFNFQFFRTYDPETIMDQVMLSGGQRVRLALAFVTAVQDVMFPNVGFLCVDEPSTHLDVPGKEGLVRVFDRMANENRSRDAQVLVVDHDPLLISGFSKHEELTKHGE